MATQDGSTDAGSGTADDDCTDEKAPEEALGDVLDLFGKKHTLAILSEFVFGDAPYRYGDLEDRLDVSSTTLSERLADLVEGSYLHRESYDEIPPRVEYEATRKTHELTPVFEDLYDWALVHETDDRE